MANAREELISKIEHARERLNRSIDKKEEYQLSTYLVLHW